MKLWHWHFVLSCHLLRPNDDFGQEQELEFPLFHSNSAERVELKAVEVSQCLFLNKSFLKKSIQDVKDFMTGFFSLCPCPWVHEVRYSTHWDWPKYWFQPKTEQSPSSFPSLQGLCVHPGWGPWLRELQLLKSRGNAQPWHSWASPVPLMPPALQIQSWDSAPSQPGVLSALQKLEFDLIFFFPSSALGCWTSACFA